MIFNSLVEENAIKVYTIVVEGSAVVRKIAEEHTSLWNNWKLFCSVGNQYIFIIY